MVKLGDTFPNFKAESTEGTIQFHDYVGDSWCVFFSHAGDATPVCTTELAKFAKLEPEFRKRNVKLLGLSCDSVESHKQWIEDIKSYGNLEGKFPYPVIADENREISEQLGLVDPQENDPKTRQPLGSRSVFIVDPNKKVRLMIIYPSSTGRNFDELLRVVDALQLTTKKEVATPADWKPGDPAVIKAKIKNEELDKLFPEGVEFKELPSGRDYMRMTRAS